MYFSQWDAKCVNMNECTSRHLCISYWPKIDTKTQQCLLCDLTWFWRKAHYKFSTIMDVQIMGAYEKSIYTNWFSVVENALFLCMNTCVMHMHVQRHLTFSPSPAFQGAQPLQLRQLSSRLLGSTQVSYL